MNGRRVLALLCGLSLGVVSAPSAAAKSDIDLAVVGVTLEGVYEHAITLFAQGGDDAAGPQRLCVQQGFASRWRSLACGPVEFGTGGTVRVLVPLPWTALTRFRAELERVGSPGLGGGVAPAPDLFSAPVTVLSSVAFQASDNW